MFIFIQEETDISMRNKISVIIIDKDYIKHDYSSIKTNTQFTNCEVYFEIKILDSDKDILKTLSDFRGVDSIISIGGESYDRFKELSKLPFEYRKKWVHIKDFEPIVITNSIIETLKANILRVNCDLFSIFTCTYRTEKRKLERLYNSLLSQSYTEWNWFIIDDSDDDCETVKILKGFNDPRITIIQNVTNHGNIGFNKHTIAMMCNGDFLVEVDHDDELTFDCLEKLHDAFIKYPDTDFVYSLTAEFKGDSEDPIVYGDGWGHGEGVTKTEIIKGKFRKFSATPNITPYSIRTIYAMPNHVRCWKRDFYHKIGGHNIDLSVLDDMDIIIRTFLQGKMARINKVLYYQYEGKGERGVDKDNTQSNRFKEIQRTVWYLKEVYDKKIHERILELGFNDDPWNEKLGHSQLWKPHTPNQNVMNKNINC